jgi:hypothetical protein
LNKKLVINYEEIESYILQNIETSTGCELIINIM